MPPAGFLLLPPSLLNPPLPLPLVLTSLSILLHLAHLSLYFSTIKLLLFSLRVIPRFSCLLLILFLFSFSFFFSFAMSAFLGTCFILVYISFATRIVIRKQEGRSVFYLIYLVGTSLKVLSWRSDVYYSLVCLVSVCLFIRMKTAKRFTSTHRHPYHTHTNLPPSSTRVTHLNIHPKSYSILRRFYR